MGQKQSTRRRFLTQLGAGALTLSVFLLSCRVWAYPGVGATSGGGVDPAIKLWAVGLVALASASSAFGASLCFSRRSGAWLGCMMGGFLGALPGVLAFALWPIISFRGDGSAGDFIATVIMIAIPVIAAVIGPPVGLITYFVRSGSNKES